MFLALFKKNDPYVLVLIPIIAFLLLFDSFNTHGFSEAAHFSPFFSELRQQLSGISNVTFFVVLGLIIIYSMYLIRINTLNLLYESRTYLEGIIFVLLITGTPEIRMLNPGICGSIFLIMAIQSILRIEKGLDLASVFNASFFLGIGTLFFFDLIFYLPFLWIALAIIKSVSFREWLVSLIGFIVPAFLTGIVLFLSDDLILVYNEMGNNFRFLYKIPDFKPDQLIYFGFTLLLLIFAFVKSSYGLQAKKIRIRKMFFIFNLFSIVAIILLFASGFDTNHWITAICFVSVVLTRYFTQMKSVFWAETLFLFFIISVLIRFFPFN